ncbi:MAG TPA: hypothetical protein VKA48_01940, partial [Gammaproteobacteria bacterium]|nr:hypothetical protein [Gammaproteobacteria bacterium]
MKLVFSFFVQYKLVGPDPPAGYEVLSDFPYLNFPERPPYSWIAEYLSETTPALVRSDSQNLKSRKFFTTLFLSASFPVSHEIRNLDMIQLRPLWRLSPIIPGCGHLRGKRH